MSEKNYTLGDRRRLIERLKESYIDIVQVADTALKYKYVSPKFRAVVVGLITNLYFKFVERLQNS